MGDLLPPPDFIEERENQDKSGSQIEKLQRKISNFKTEEKKQSEIGRAIFLATPDKLRKQKLSEFLA